MLGEIAVKDGFDKGLVGAEGNFGFQGFLNAGGTGAEGEAESKPLRHV